jgi:hypothetical protein
MGVVVIGGWDTKVKTTERSVDAKYHRNWRAGTLVIRVPKMTAEQLRTAREMYESGAYLREIAAVVGKSTGAIGHRVRRDGWRRSPQGQAAHGARFSAKQIANARCL